MKQMLNGNLLVAEQKKEEQKLGSIILTTQTEEYFKEVEVILPDDEVTVKEKDVLYISTRSGTPINLDGVEYLVINIREIIAKK
jgi:chaperonin GroES